MLACWLVATEMVCRAPAETFGSATNNLDTRLFGGQALAFDQSGRRSRAKGAAAIWRQSGL